MDRFGKKCFLRGKLAPSLLHTIPAFWLDFEGLGFLGCSKNDKKHTWKICFWDWKSVLTCVCVFFVVMISGTFLGLFLELQDPFKIKLAFCQNWLAPLVENRF